MSRTPTQPRVPRLTTRALLTVSLLGLNQCALFEKEPEGEGYAGGQASTGGGESTECSTTRQFFAQEVWPKVMAEKCINCHAPGGLAAERFSSLRLYPSSYPGFLDESLASLNVLAKTEYEDESVLLLKPLGELEHGGAVQLKRDSEEYALLSELVERLQEQESCAATLPAEAVVGVELESAQETFRKASLMLSGRLPSADELSLLQSEDDSALPGLIDQLTAEPGFKDWLLLTFNDMLLTDRYLRDSTNALNREDFPNIELYLNDEVEREEQDKYRRAVAREPLELIWHVVNNDLPFTEILTADYTLLNPYAAAVYNNTGLAFENPEDESDYQPGSIFAIRDGKAVRYPHAGVLSSPMFLNRFPTSRTNRNRHRARMVYDMFLATDILKIGERPIDPTKSVAYANPTREDPACSVCHSVIDPLAGAFMQFDDNDQERLTDREWYQEMFLPGVGQAQMQVSDYDAALPWAAERLAADPRFPISVVYNAFRALTGQQPLGYPADGDAGRYRAWEAQDTTFRAIAEQFVADNYNYRTVIRDLVLTPYFRAKSASAEVLADHTAELEAYGTARLSSPEKLVRKLRAIVGFNWGRSPNEPTITTTYNILYGGIDSNLVTERLTEPNGVMASVMSRVANEIACQATAWDLLQPADMRLLFPMVELEDTPETAPERIVANLQYLHQHVLGEVLAEGDPALEQSYQLFEETWREGFEGVMSEALDRRPPWQCQGRWNRVTGEDLPEEEILDEDENYVIRSWMAVLTYLLLDYRLLYE